jgi:hypothetical protein
MYYFMYNRGMNVMGMRTVRLDDETEQVLKQLTRTTGWSVSAALKQGLMALREHVAHHAPRRPYEVYRRLDLGPGGYGIAPSTESRRGVAAALKRKHRR